MAERVLQNTQATLSKQFFSGDTPADPGVVTVTVVALDGTIIASGTAGGTATDPRTFTLNTTNTALLNTLTVSWASATLGTLKSSVETVGGFLFSLSELRERTGATPTNDDLADARTYAETQIEQQLGYALVPRYARDTLSARHRNSLRLRQPYIRAIRSVTADGTALSPSALAALRFDYGFLHGYGWTTGYGNVVVGYEHGLDAPPPGASNAALDEALAYLGEGDTSINPRAESVTTAAGTVRLRTANGLLLSGTANDWVAGNRLLPV